MVAVLGNNSEILRLLVEAHADINAQDAVCDLRDNVTTLLVLGWQHCVINCGICK